MSKAFFTSTGIFILCCLQCSSQVFENFSDGDFINNPVWSGSASSFFVNTDYQLQSNNTNPNSSYYLTTPNSLATNAEWQFYVRMDFNPSSKNYIDVYITSASADLLSSTNTGYFVRLGNTLDQIALYVKKADGTISEIIDGQHGILNKNKIEVRIKVSRNAGGLWTLYRQVLGVDNDFIIEGAVTENIFTTSRYFGILINQSTSGFFSKHFIDDIVVNPFTVSNGPNIISVTGKSYHDIDILFDRDLEVASATDLNNYFLDHNLGKPEFASVDISDHSLVHLRFVSAFPENESIVINVFNIKDLNGNLLKNGTASLVYHFSRPYEIIIDEIMADPIPPVSLPEDEWIEIQNTSSMPVNITGWKILKAGKLSGPLPNTILKPDSFAIICKTTAVPNLIKFGKVLGVSNFPTLANNSDIISLLSVDGRVIHAVGYSKKWYQNPVKEKGGWTLEMIDTKNPCGSINNWKASVDQSGGTPGRKNSVDGLNPDTKAPRLLRAYTRDNQNISLVFDKPLDSLTASEISNFNCSDNIGVESCSPVPPFFNVLNLKLSNTLENHKMYSISVSGIADCAGNKEINNTTKISLPDACRPSDIIINELLYRPKHGGSDFIELFNRSDHTVDLKNISIARRDDMDQLTDINPLSNQPYFLFPGEYALITKDTAKVLSQYYTPDSKCFMEFDKFPSLSKDSGNISFLNERGEIIDEIHYSEKWQFPLLSTTEGVSLERIDYNGPSIADNFHSAASSSGYGTPGYKNSQLSTDISRRNGIEVTPDIISPDNDGIDDIAFINYDFKSPGSICSIKIYDTQGRPVKTLVNNAVCGTSGNFKWDGLGGKQQQLKMGIYIIITEVLNTISGEKKIFKNAVVLARK